MLRFVGEVGKFARVVLQIEELSLIHQRIITTFMLPDLLRPFAVFRRAPERPRHDANSLRPVVPLR